MSLTHGSLFTGIGGFDLGFERAGIETIWQVECDPYCLKVLEKHWPNVRRYTDITEIDWGAVPRPDILSGGFPCQDISNAGKRAGITGSRSGLWVEFRRAIVSLRPRYVVVENVAALYQRGLDTVLGDLATCGYDAEWDCLPAAAVGAPHLRERIFLVAYPQCDEHRRTQQGIVSQEESVENLTQSQDNTARVVGGTSEGGVSDERLVSWCHDAHDDDVADAAQREGHGHDAEQGHGRTPTQAIFGNGGGLRDGGGWWATEPGVGRVVDGFSSELDATSRRLGYGKMDNSEAIAAIDRFRQQVLRRLRNAATASASPLRVEEGIYQDFMSAMPHQYAHEGWNMGTWIEKDQRLRDMWKAICSAPLNQTQDVQQDLLIRIREKERTQKMGKSRVDRLKCLGNAIVPQIAEAIGRMIVAAE